MNLTFVLIPGWVQQALKAANLPLSTALDVVKLSSILSKDDVSFYCYSNPILLEQMYPDLARQTLPHGCDVDEDIQRRMGLLAISGMKVSRNNAYESAYFIPEAAIPDDTQVNTVDLFELVEIANNTFAVIPVKVSTKDINAKVLLKNCYDKAVALMHRYFDFNTIATSHLFRAYTRLAIETARL